MTCHSITDPGPVNGSHFMTSQLGYLRGLDCSHHEIHFLCQESFDDDVRRRPFRLPARCRPSCLPAM